MSTLVLEPRQSTPGNLERDFKAVVSGAAFPFRTKLIFYLSQKIKRLTIHDLPETSNLARVVRGGDYDFVLAHTGEQEPYIGIEQVQEIRRFDEEIPICLFNRDYSLGIEAQQAQADFVQINDSFFENILKKAIEYLASPH
jgi:hypothetical protein